jgi:hypothetical protein
MFRRKTHLSSRVDCMVDHKPSDAGSSRGRGMIHRDKPASVLRFTTLSSALIYLGALKNA